MISWLTAAIGIAALFGLNVGSFLNVVIWRLPRGGSLASPTWSYCPRCDHRLGALDLVPVLSFLALRARCRYCGNPISWRYPGIELLTGALFAAVAWHLGAGSSQDLPVALDIGFECLFVAVLICVFFVDLEHFIIPDGLNVAGILIGLAHWGVIGLLVGSWHPLRSSLIGTVSYGLVLDGIGFLAYVVLVGVRGRRGPLRAARTYLVETASGWGWIVVYYAGAVIPPLRRYAEPPPPLEGFTAAEIEADEDEGGIGGADPKLAAAIGANLLFPLWLHSFVYAIVLGTIQSIITLVATGRRLGQRTAIPFGPALALGALFALFFGDAVWGWYVRHFLSFPGSPFVPGSPPAKLD